MQKFLVASALVATVVAQSPQCFASVDTVVVKTADAKTEVEVWFETPVMVWDKPQIIAYDSSGILKASPTIHDGRTMDNEEWFFDVEGLMDGYSYKVTFPTNQAHPCIQSEDFAGICQTRIFLDTGVEASPGTPGGNQKCGEARFVYNVGPVVGVITQSAVGVGIDVIRFDINWNREVHEIYDDDDELGIMAVDKNGNTLEIRDITFVSRKKWSFSVIGANGNEIQVSLPEGAVAVDGSGAPNAESVDTLTVPIRYLQDCVAVYKWGEPIDLCKINDGANCIGNGGKVYVDGIRQSPTQVSLVAALFGGESCPAQQQDRVKPCTCPYPGLDQCGAIDPVTKRGSKCGTVSGGTAEEPCSCESNCLTSPNGCCFEMLAACPAFSDTPQDLPSCASPSVSFTYPAGSVQCMETARASDGNVLCYCDQWCKEEGNCCKDFDENCFEGLCQKKALGQFCNAEYEIGQYTGCQCDRDCLAIGDCCRDFTTFCGGQPLCASPGNCNKMMGSSTGSWCMCDHECLSKGDCCTDYEAKCEVQATCQYYEISDSGVKNARSQPSRRTTFQTAYAGVSNYYVGPDPQGNSQLNTNFETERLLGQKTQKYTWTPIAAHIPAFGCGSVRFVDNNSWCSCDDECTYWGDCCNDYTSRCLLTRW